MRTRINSRLLRLEPTDFSAREITLQALQIKNVVDFSFLRSGGTAGSREEIERASNASVDQKASPLFAASSLASSDQGLRMRIAVAKGGGLPFSPCGRRWRGHLSAPDEGSLSAKKV
jgi:hypothetical protein